ncbi:hypothetical protein [Lactobacillus helveticus]|uniref:hypothetical protein n=1 Tax=Lactobacillus helveticus TaxID=1587 RepID=UPI000696E628|nr:hypothetical protein [Lactobacillus helveticus]
MVNNPYYSFPTKDAINFATDSTGTVVNPNKVKASQDEVLSNSASEHEVRGDAQEGVGVADKPEQTGKSASSWFKHYRTSGNWGKGASYATMYKSSHNTRAHIVAYKLKNVPNRYIMQKLPWLPWGQFTRLLQK